jgi:nucleoside phosphorylase
MRVLVTFAVEAEFVPWQKLRKLDQVTINGITGYQAEIGRAVVDLVVTGMGAENTLRVVQEAMASPYSFCIAAGFAGGLRPGYKVGEILVARAVQQCGDPRTIECASNLVTEAIQDGAKPVSLFLATDHVVSTAEEKSKLAPFAEAVDMESFSVLAVARAHPLPAVAIRVVSDLYDRDMPANIGATVDEKGNVRVGGVMKYVATHPLALPALIRLGRESRTAAEALAHFLETYINKLSFEAQDWAPAELEDIAAT